MHHYIEWHAGIQHDPPPAEAIPARAQAWAAASATLLAIGAGWLAAHQETVGAGAGGVGFLCCKRTPQAASEHTWRVTMRLPVLCMWKPR